MTLIIKQKLNSLYENYDRFLARSQKITQRGNAKPAISQRATSAERYRQHQRYLRTDAKAAYSRHVRAADPGHEVQSTKARTRA